MNAWTHTMDTHTYIHIPNSDEIHTWTPRHTHGHTHIHTHTKFKSVSPKNREGGNIPPNTFYQARKKLIPIPLKETT